jgi:mannose-6-phosphate isomerase-like protein (cupin superfamily)
MKTTLLTLALGAVTMTGASGEQDPAVQHFPASEVAAVFTKGGQVTEGSNYKVLAALRTTGGESEVHELDTDIFQIMSGSATFVTGGTMVGAKTTGPGEIRGTGIDGGQTRTLSKGDVLVIRKGVPHWFKDVQARVEYFVVKVR